MVAGRHPKCTCPDFAKGNLCKHILFVMLRVLKLGRDNPLVWQKALTRSEAQAVLAAVPQARADASVMADAAVMKQYKRAAQGKAKWCRLFGKLGAEMGRMQVVFAPAAES